MRLPAPIQNVVDALAKLPSIGPRQAIRLTFYLIGEGKPSIAHLGASIAALQNIKICERCFFIHANTDNLCDVCRNPHRNQKMVMVVEKETDYISLENTGKYMGRYLIVGEIPKTGFLEDWQKQRLESFKKFVAANYEGKVDEIISGFNPTSLGDFQAGLITKELAPFTNKISRLGRGLPTGGEIEFADDETLGSALERRN